MLKIKVAFWQKPKDEQIKGLVWINLINTIMIAAIFITAWFTDQKAIIILSTIGVILNIIIQISYNKRDKNEGNITTTS